MPNAFFRRELHSILESNNSLILKKVIPRVNYYFTRSTKFNPSGDEFISLRDLSCFKKSAYYYDLRSILRYYPQNLKFQCWLRDVITVPEEPCFVKCRPIDQEYANSAILKLNQVRHYRKIDDRNSFSGKKSKLVWRGSVHQRGWRAEFLKKFHDNPLCDVGALKGTGGLAGNHYEKEFLSINEQLKYKFIFSIEGADVATNLKWIAQSNSLCFMKKPRHESWFMENSLIPDFHYVLVDENFDDVSKKIQYYLDNPDEAEVIISNFQKFYSQFEDATSEMLIAIIVALKYFYLSGQLSLERFGLGFLESDFLGSN